MILLLPLWEGILNGLVVLTFTATHGVVLGCA